MSTRTTRPEPNHSSDVSTDRPGPIKRLTSTLVWYSPELTGIAVSAGAAATVWAPLGVISAGLGTWIATNQVNIARERHRARRALTRSRRERAQLDAAEHDGETSKRDGETSERDGEASTDTAHEHTDDDPASDHSGDSVSGAVSGDGSADVSGTDTATGAPAAEERRSGWGVAG